MKVKRILTNNAIVTTDDNNEEIIVCGKGIGYKKKTGDAIDTSLINQIFVMIRSPLTKRLESLLQDIPLEYIEVADRIIKMASLELDRKLNEGLLISLSDHLYYAVTRFLEGVNISNGLIWEIKQFYEAEFEVGLKALRIIEQRLKVDLPEAEAAYIAMHILNTEMEDSDMDEVYQMTRVIKEICNIVKFHFSVSFDTKSAYYYRFITHLKFFARRLVRKNQYNDNTDINVFDAIRTTYGPSYECVGRIGKFLENKYDYVLCEEEKLYLTIHIQRAVYKGGIREKE